MFFIGQNLKHVHMTFFSWTFGLLLFGVYFSPHQRNIVCEYKLHGKRIMKYQNELVSDIDVEKPVF